MRYISIDIETTTANVADAEIIAFAAVVDDLSNQIGRAHV